MYYVGIDIGGTNVKAGLIDETGKVIKKSSIKTDSARDPESIISDIANQINELASGVTYNAVGIGCPGAIDSENGIVVYSNNLCWKNVRLAESLSRQINNTQVKVCNDANAAALGEATFGSGKNYSDIVFITLGTGVGGGIVADGKLFEGYKSMGAEVGHMVINVDGEQCTCGRKGCLEAYASATALIRETTAAMTKNPDSVMWKICGGDILKVDGKTCFEAAKSGDKAAKAVVDNYIKSLSEGILNVINIFRSQAIILGGGVCAQGTVLTKPIQDYIDKNKYGGIDSLSVKILIASLGNDAGILGAASLIIDKN